MMWDTLYRFGFAATACGAIFVAWLLTRISSSIGMKLRDAGWLRWVVTGLYLCAAVLVWFALAPSKP